MNILKALSISILVLFVLVIVAEPQEGTNGDCRNQSPDCSIHADYGNIRYLCSDTEFDYYRVSINGAYTNIYVGDYTSGTGFVFDTDSAITRQFRFPLGSHWAQLWVGSYFVGLSDAGNTACTDSVLNNSQEETVECVGFVIEGLREFTIDGETYYTSDGFVSWRVSVNSLWTWIMTSNGQYVMTFSQDQIGNCYIVDINYEWNAVQPEDTEEPEWEATDEPDL